MEVCKDTDCPKPSCTTCKHRLTTPVKTSAFDQQVAGDHYKVLGVQPLELVLRNRGYVAFSGACYTKVVKYMDRKKDNEVEQLKKARHILSMWIEEAEKQDVSSKSPTTLNTAVRQGATNE